MSGCIGQHIYKLHTCFVCQLGRRCTWLLGVLFLCRPSFPQRGSALHCSTTGEWDELPGFKTPLGPPRVKSTREELSKYFPVSSALFPVLPVQEAPTSGAIAKINKTCGFLWLCDALPTF